MNYLLYLIGFIGGAAIFLYLISLYHTGKERLGKAHSPQKKSQAPSMNVEPQFIFHKKHGRTPGERICPLCGSVLTRNEALYATPVAGSKGSRILILGCRYCYSENDEGMT